MSDHRTSNPGCQHDSGQLGSGLISLSAVNKTYGDFVCLENVSFEVAAGETVAVIGPSGSGKTTVLRVIAGLEVFQSGSITVAGRCIHALPSGTNVDRHLAKSRENISGAVGLVFQQLNLFPHLTAEQNIALAPVQLKRASKEAALSHARGLLARMGLEGKANSRPATLSGGQQQRVAIARALALDPKVMLFDEATSALDPEVVGEVLHVMSDLAKSGTTMIAVTHEMQFAQEVADRVVVMDEGRIVEQGNPAQVFTSPTADRTREFLRRVLDPIHSE